MKMLGTQVPPDVKQAVEEEAERAGISMSAWLRYQLMQLTDTLPQDLEKRPPPDKGD